MARRFRTHVVRRIRSDGSVYDALTTSYRFSCPRHGETSVRLSRFRRLEELPGPHHPAVYRIEFACGCGDEHPGLVSHDELDWAPLGLDEPSTLRQPDDVAQRLASPPSSTELAAQRIRAGEWPWSFFCWPEDRPRPVFPSAFRLLADGGRDGRVGVAVRARRAAASRSTSSRASTSTCRSTTTARSGSWRITSTPSWPRRSTAFQAELYSESFDVRRLALVRVLARRRGRTPPARDTRGGRGGHRCPLHDVCEGPRRSQSAHGKPTSSTSSSARRCSRTRMAGRAGRAGPRARSRPFPR